MKVNVISYEPAGGWVLYDYAERLATHLAPHVRHVELSFEQRPGFDVTFHVNYGKFHEVKATGMHSTLVTHIDTPRKFELVCAQAQGGIWGFCCSEETARRLNELSGTTRFVSFAPPALMPAEPARVSVLVSGRLYPDGRKNQSWVVDFMRRFSPGQVLLRVMGAGWAEWLAPLVAAGYEVQHHDGFDRERYREWLLASTHLLYTGNDEGALSTLDALNHGVTPIVTAQGYHLELAGELLLFATHEQLMAIGTRLENEMQAINAARHRLTDWDGFAARHAAFWREQLRADAAQRRAAQAAAAESSAAPAQAAVPLAA
ncbi:MAG: hypothetical protein JNN18_07270 [Rubrivivax sp.]|nr:hypothetical protein [Rubrivivax sp.]